MAEAQSGIGYVKVGDLNTRVVMVEQVTPKEMSIKLLSPDLEVQVKLIARATSTCGCDAGQEIDIEVDGEPLDI